MTVLLTGADGQLSYALQQRLSRTERVVALTHKQLDLTDEAGLVENVLALRPTVVINGAAYNDVDGAEGDPVTALEVNAFGVRALARAAALVDATLIHFSTDFVFDGNAEQPYTEKSPTNPQSVYAISKLLGEWFASESKHYVIRVESLFGGGVQKHLEGHVRGSSLDRMADSILCGTEVRAFEDRIVSPSYVEDVADVTVQLLGMTAPFGLYHCVSTGMASWFEVAVELANRLGCPEQVVPITMASVSMKARRPRFSALSSAKLASLGVELPTWQDAISRYAAARLAEG